MFKLEKNLIRKHNWLVHDIIYKKMKIVAKKYAKGVLLDIGCGEMPYKSVFEPYIEKYIGLDHENSLHDLSGVEIIADAYNTTFPDQSVDTVLSTAVLEHLEEPNKAIVEMYRILKVNGIAILAAPFFWHLHEIPRDFFRYSPFGLRYLFEKNKFHVLDIYALSGFWVTFLQEFVYYIQRFKFGKLSSDLINLIGHAIQRIAQFLDKKDNCSQFSWMHIIIATKVF